MTYRTRNSDNTGFNHRYSETSQYSGACNPNVVEIASGYYLRTGRDETMSDIVTPRFRSRVAKGEVFFNPMTHTKRTASALSTSEMLIIATTSGCGAGKNIRNTTVNGFSRLLPVDASSWLSLYKAFPDSDLESLLTEVSTGVLNKRGRSNNNLFESLAEIDQTFDLFHHPIKKANITLNRVMRDISLGRGVGSAVRAGSGGYLMYRYGIRPLIQDIQGIVTGLQRKVGKMRLTARSQQTVSSVAEIPFSKTLGIITGYGTCSVNDSVYVRGMSLDEGDVTLLNNIGFSSKNLLTLPYELVTLSFVADWFANIGDFIGAIAPAFGWRNLGSCLTVERMITNQFVINSNTNSSGSYTLASPILGSAISSNMTKYRIGLKAPGVVVRQDFGFDKATRVADALALLAQRIRGLRTFVPKPKPFRNQGIKLAVFSQPLP